jgi:hypothetical protein
VTGAARQPPFYLKVGFNDMSPLGARCGRCYQFLSSERTFLADGEA